MVKQYICEHCGYIFEEPDVHKYIEPRGEYWGFSASEAVYVATCPNCGSEEFERYWGEDEEDEEE